MLCLQTVKVYLNYLLFLEPISFVFCYERNYTTSLCDNNQADMIEAFNSTSRYLDNLLHIDNLEGMVNQIYQPDLQLNKANASDTATPFKALHPKFMISATILILHSRFSLFGW